VVEHAFNPRISVSSRPLVYRMRKSKREKASERERWRWERERERESKRARFFILRFKTNKKAEDVAQLEQLA
jgi:tRNA U38,U39,U40 pseudouridine synthase TruA